MQCVRVCVYKYLSQWLICEWLKTICQQFLFVVDGSSLFMFSEDILVIYIHTSISTFVVWMIL